MGDNGDYWQNIYTVHYPFSGSELGESQKSVRLCGVSVCIWVRPMFISYIGAGGDREGY